MIVNTPLRYPGGKSILSNFISKVIVANDLHGCHYVEPYCGGAGAALNLLFEGYVSTIALNDIDERIYAFWLSAVQKTNKLIDLIERTPVTVREWEKQKRVYENAGVYGPLDVGFATLFLNRCNYSGVLKGGIIGGKQQDGIYKINARFNKHSLVKRVQRIGSHRKYIMLSNEDGIDFIKSAATGKKHKTFFYIDPPYHRKSKNLYRNAYRDDDHKALKTLLASRKSMRWVLSYDNCNFIASLYSDFKLKKIRLWHSVRTYSGVPTSIGGELIVHSPLLKMDGLPTAELKRFRATA